MDANTQFLELCGIRQSRKLASKRAIWNNDLASEDTCERLACTNSKLEDYIMAFTSSGEVADLAVRIRVNAILLMALGVAKQKLVSSLDMKDRPDVERRLGTLFWGLDQVVSVPVSFVNPCDIRSSVFDYVLWYSDTRELKTNLVVIRVDEPMDELLEEQYCLAVMAGTAMIHHGRTKQQMVQGTYGVITDGLKWTFLHVDKHNEYSLLKLNWQKHDERTIVGLIGKILDEAISVKMRCKETDVETSSWLPDWSQMAKKWDSPKQDGWDSPKHDGSEDEDEMDSLRGQDDPHLQPFKSYSARKMEFLQEFKEGCKDLLRQAFHGERVENKLEHLHQSKIEKVQDRNKRKGIETIAVTEIDPNELFSMFKLKRETNAGNYWRVAPWKVRQVTNHLLTSLEQIRLVVGRAKHNEAAIRLTIDAIMLDILTSIKAEAGQSHIGKGKGKRPSTESFTSVKSLKMAVETDIAYIFPTNNEGAIIDKRISGRMDYNIWYGQPREAETNLLVVEAKHKNTLAAGRYQAISYMALIQHARYKAGRQKIPIYGISTDSEDWDFIRMDATGNVAIQQFNWQDSKGSQIISLIYKILREASCLTPVATQDLAREHTVTGRTSLCLTNSNGTPA
ncbi:hypothetical protein BJX64DRAFT_295970 [Aspergillus heterothallicus]